ncbi:TauD/TfdA family dioxygenase [Parvularcula sp. IMCC14364]|uniref:TauD/TfdA dioxygenase family protein n=1 Tax=Parvularcula sp. IMCC14364 TaxID=3067902 RepID=UPI002741B53E|nr:TauD/TfdA family dioxygenase [Parvularcula sp. IMCC14364]
MSIKVTPSGTACGAEITGLDISQPLTPETVREIRDAWLTHHVVSFPDQKLSDDDLERFALYFGDFGEDTFFGPIAGRTHIAAIKRGADETTPIFADVWHTDWSFQAHPPAATILYGIKIPPIGGDTLFANQHLALEKMPHGLREKIALRTGIHSAALGYAKGGAYGDSDKEKGRSMDIRPSDKALEQQSHPLIRQHPETGRPGIFGTIGAYVIGVEGMRPDESLVLLSELSAWQTQDAFVYTHKWQENMLIMWDNRSVLHKATSGYEGYDRLLHRITIAERDTD